MRLFYYVHTGHRIGLDRFRRAATIIRALGDVDVTLLCSDFRIASAAREYGVKRAVGIDVVRNIPQIAQRGDKIIFDSAELNPAMHEDMVNFFSTFIRVSDAPDDVRHPREALISPYLSGERIFTGVVIDPRYFEPQAKTIDRAFFFGDDDYEEDLFALQERFAPLELELLQGFYWFLGYEDKLKKSFKALHESDDYDAVIRSSDTLVTASPQAALEHLASGGHPLFIQRKDYPKDYLDLLNSLRIPCLESPEVPEMSRLLTELGSHPYADCPETTDKLKKFLKAELNLSNLNLI